MCASFTTTARVEAAMLPLIRTLRPSEVYSQDSGLPKIIEYSPSMARAASSRQRIADLKPSFVGKKPDHR